MTILSMKAKKNAGCLILIGKSNHQLLTKKVKYQMYLHDAVITMDQKFSWYNLAINHSILLLLRNQIISTIHSPNVGLPGLCKNQHTQTYSRCTYIWEALMEFIHVVSQILESLILPPS